MTLLNRYDPLRDLAPLSFGNLRDLAPLTFGKLFDYPEFVTGWPLEPSRSEVAVREGQYVVRLDVPGFSFNDLDVSVTERALSVYGETETRKFSRQWTLPKGLDLDKITAVLENGVLTLTLEKPEVEAPKKIKIQVK